MKATARDLRASAAGLEKAAKVLDQEMPSRTRGWQETTAQGFRRGTISGRYCNGDRVPYLRLSGRWLRRAGFELGQKFQIRVDYGR